MKKTLLSLLACSSICAFAESSGVLFINNIGLNNSVTVNIMNSKAGALNFTLAPLEACFVNNSENYIPAAKGEQTVIKLTDGSSATINKNNDNLSIIPNEISTGVTESTPRFYISSNGGSWVTLDNKSLKSGTPLLGNTTVGVVANNTSTSSKTPADSHTGHIFSCEDKSSGFGNANKGVQTSPASLVPFWN
ncbi:MAG: hypothetical protein K2Y14_04585 [Burkholderiales bacterium]|nr:hypothetical protein [Burkholderiales bacterium]MBX9890062.1 hypothetical protein [Amoebophilaceae bacterium]